MDLESLYNKGTIAANLTDLLLHGMSLQHYQAVKGHIEKLKDDNVAITVNICCHFSALQGHMNLSQRRYKDWSRNFGLDPGFTAISDEELRGTLFLKQHIHFR